MALIASVPVLGDEMCLIVRITRLWMHLLVGTRHGSARISKGLIVALMCRGTRDDISSYWYSGIFLSMLVHVLRYSVALYSLGTCMFEHLRGIILLFPCLHENGSILL